MADRADPHTDCVVPDCPHCGEKLVHAQRGHSAVTRDEFETLCLVVELMLAAPGGVADQLHNLGWEGKGILEVFAKMRRKPPVFGARNDGADA